MNHLKKFCLIVSAVLLVSCVADKKPKYVFYFIGDGMGVNQVLGTQMYLAEKSGRIGTEALSFTEFPYSTMASTYSRYNSVTCSAASGTALASGFKTKNDAIGMDSLLQNPLYSIAVAAKESGHKVGICTTVSIDHATPAVFYAHQKSRKMGYEIAMDAARSGFDFFAGAGFSICKKDSLALDVIDVLRDSGYLILKGYSSFLKQVDSSKKTILLQKEKLSSLPYAIDRKETDLTLSQITQAAIRLLYDERSQKGFFVMIEGGLIDWACHSNDAATVFREVDDFSEAIRNAVDFYREHPDETLIVVTADHETGGISLGTGSYSLNLKILSYQKCSLYELTREMDRLRKEGLLDSWLEVKTLLTEKLGFWKEVELTQQEEDFLKEVYDKTIGKKSLRLVQELYGENEMIAKEAVSILNKKAKIAWNSGGHSAGFVPVFAVGVGAEEFSKVMDNTDIPRKIKHFAGYSFSSNP